MKKQDIIKKIQKGLKLSSAFVDKHSPEILIGAGIAGFVSTCVIVAKRAPIAKEKLEDLHEELAKLEEEPTKGKVIFEEFKTVAPVYAPAVVTGTVSVASILASYKIGSKRAAALATAYELTQATFDEYRAKVRETIGEKKEQKVVNDIAQDRVNANPPTPAMGAGEVIMTDGLSLFYDPWGGRYFRSSVEIVRKAEKTIADRLYTEMYLPLNDLYYELGLSNTKTGDLVGFNVDDGVNIIFNSCIAPDNTPCMVLEFTCGPRMDYGCGGRW